MYGAGLVRTAAHQPEASQGEAGAWDPRDHGEPTPRAVTTDPSACARTRLHGVSCWWPLPLHLGARTLDEMIVMATVRQCHATARL